MEKYIICGAGYCNSCGYDGIIKKHDDHQGTVFIRHVTKKKPSYMSLYANTLPKSSFYKMKRT